MESQVHGFKFEDIILNTIFDNKNIIKSIQQWKKKDYTSIFDIPEYSYLKKYQDLHNIKTTFSEKEYLTSLKLNIKLPISIKSTKYSKSINKKIEFGDIQRTIKNFSLYNIKEFSIIIIEYKQFLNKKQIINTIVSNMDANNNIIKNITKFAKTFDLDLLDKKIKEIKQLPSGIIKKEVKSNLRKNIKQIINENSCLNALVKIDSKKQRRVQCSIKKNDFVLSQKSIDITNSNILFYLLLDNIYEIISNERTFNT